jgi:hypothetical protein
MSGSFDLFPVSSFPRPLSPRRRGLAAIVAAAGASLIAGASMAGTTPVISEVRTGQPGPDTSEYFEIRGVPGTSLDGFWYVVVGDAELTTPPAQNGFIEAAINLSGLTIPASGRLVVAEATFALGTANFVTNLPFEDNDNVTHLLVTGFTGAVGTDIDTNDDGTIDTAPWASIASSVGIAIVPDPDGISAEFLYSPNIVGPDSGAAPSLVYLCENSDDVYQIGNADPTVGDDTPGLPNPECDIGPAPIQINEIRIDQGGADNDEYFELSGTAGTSLAGYFYLVLGDGTGGSGVIETVVDLSTTSIPAGGYLLVAESTFTLGGQIPDLNVGATGLNFENGDNVTHLLVRNFTGTNGQDLDTNNDGVLDITPWTEVVDSVGLLVGPSGQGGNEFIYSATAVGPDGGFVPSHVYRCFPNGQWLIGTFAAFTFDTPRAENPACPGCGTEGSCFEVRPNPGCDVVDCCDLVCAVDPTCCITDWDAACVAAAVANCNSTGAAPTLSLNEIRAGQTGADNDTYAEIVGAPGTSLKGVAYVVVGDGLDANGVVESVTLLDGTIPADGIFLVSRSTLTIGAPDLVRDSLNFEDGETTTHFLVWNFNGALNVDLDADNDCTLDSQPWASIIDALVLKAPENCGYAATVVGPDGSFSPSHAYKCSPDGTWTVGLFDSLVNDTPGLANANCPAPDPCGALAPQDCFTQAKTPGCSDADCCNAVCALDPTCCALAWDAECVSQASVACAGPGNPPAVNFSEVRTDQVGADNDEYFELFGDAGTVLNGVTYVVIGDGSAAQGSGVVEMALPLDGFVIPTDQFLLAAKNTFTLTGAIPDVVVGTGLVFENTDNVTHLLVWQFEGAVGQDLDTNDDGTLDATPWASVIDEFSLRGPAKGGDLTYSSIVVGPDGTFVPSHVKYCPSTGVWTLGTFDPALSSDTPGLANPDCVYAKPCLGDLDLDGDVDAGDLAILLGAWGNTGGAADLNASGTVEAGDLAILLGAWGLCG